jgi:mono/diheme cytochrome c family protein
VDAGAAQTQARSSTAGVYTEDQATRGADVFAGMCKSCHTPSVHTGPTFLKTWADRPLWDLFEFISTKMPKNDPGGMFPEEYAQVVAYLLKLNGQPAGPAELPSDSLVLKTIRFEAAEKVRKGQ